MIETPLQKKIIDKKNKISKPFGERMTFGPKKNIGWKALKPMLSLTKV